MNRYFHARLIYLIFTHIKYSKLLSVRKTSVKTLLVATSAPTGPPPPPLAPLQLQDMRSTGIFFRRLFHFFLRFGVRHRDYDIITI